MQSHESQKSSSFVLTVKEFRVVRSCCSLLHAGKDYSSPAFRSSPLAARSLLWSISGRRVHIQLYILCGSVIEMDIQAKSIIKCGFSQSISIVSNWFLLAHSCQQTTDIRISTPVKRWWCWNDTEETYSAFNLACVMHARKIKPKTWQINMFWILQIMTIK